MLEIISALRRPSNALSLLENDFFLFWFLRGVNQLKDRQLTVKGLIPFSYHHYTDNCCYNVM